MTLEGPERAMLNRMVWNAVDAELLARNTGSESDQRYADGCIDTIAAATHSNSHEIHDFISKLADVVATIERESVEVA